MLLLQHLYRCTVDDERGRVLDKDNGAEILFVPVGRERQRDLPGEPGTAMAGHGIDLLERAGNEIVSQCCAAVFAARNVGHPIIFEHRGHDIYGIRTDLTHHAGDEGERNCTFAARIGMGME